MMPTTHVSLADLFPRLADAGISICVLRGYEALPETVENDLDLMVHPHDAQRFRSILLDFARDSGLSLVAVADHHHVTLIRFLGVDESGAVSRLIVDEHLRGAGWWGIPFLTNEEVFRDARRQGAWCIPRPAHEAAMALLTHLLIGRRVKDKHLRRLPHLISDDSREFSRLLSDAFGSRLAVRLVDAVHGGDTAALAAMAWRLRLQLLGSGIAGDPGLAIEVARDRWAQVRLKTARRGLAVSVDAAGAREHAAAVARSTRLVFKDAWFVGSRLEGAAAAAGFGQWFEGGRLAIAYRTATGVLRERLVLVSPDDGDLPRAGLHADDGDPSRTVTGLIEVLSRRAECDAAAFLQAARPSA